MYGRSETSSRFLFIERRRRVLRIAIAVEIPARIDEGIHCVGLRGPGLRTSGKLRSRIPGLHRAANALAGDLICRGSNTGNWSSGPEQLRRWGNGLTGIGVPSSAGGKRPSPDPNVIAALPNLQTRHAQPSCAALPRWSAAPGPEFSTIPYSSEATVIVAGSASSPHVHSRRAESPAGYRSRTSCRTRNALIVRRHGHDGSRAITHQHEIANPNRTVSPLKGFIARRPVSKPSFSTSPGPCCAVRRSFSSPPPGLPVPAGRHNFVLGRQNQTGAP